jgi:hypothetical protein
MLALGLFLFNTVALAQNAGAVSVYKAQLLMLHSKTDSILATFDNPRTRRAEVKEELFTISKLLHRLQEESFRTNGEDIQAGKSANKDLLIIEQACILLDFMAESMTNFIDTNDKVFLLLAKDANNLAIQMRKIL